MKLFKKLLLISSLVVTSNATTLKEIINDTLHNNLNLKALEIQNQSLQKNYESVENIFNPSLNVGINYLQLDGDTRAVQVGSTTTAFAKFSTSLYDGGKSSAIKEQKKYEYKSAKQSTDTTKRETILKAVTLFFQTKTIQENIKVFEEKTTALEAQYKRVKIKYDIKMATIDEVLKLKSEYESTEYLIEELKYQKEELLQNLSLLTNKNITFLDDSKLPTLQNIDYKESSSVESLKLSLKAQNEVTNITSSVNLPQLKLEDSFNVYSYNDYNSKILTDLPDKQNQLMLTLSYNLFDTTSKDKIEALRLAHLASKQKLEYVKNQEKMIFNLATKKLITLQHKLNSLKSAVEMGNSVYDMVKIKYQNGIVDNIAYLDALSKKIYNIALYKQALNDYEIAKANYYFSSGKDFETFLI